MNIDALILYYTNLPLPSGPVRLNACSVILDCRKYVDTHIAQLQTYGPIPIMKPAYERMQLLASRANKNMYGSH